MQPVSARTRPSHPGAGDRARLRIEGVSAPIVTRVARRRDDALVVVQELPFLRLDARVLDENDREARISRVAIDVENDVPRIVLELAYEDAGDGESEVRTRAVDPVESWDRRDATLGYGEPPKPRASRVKPFVRREASDSERAPRKEGTLVFRTEPASERADDTMRTSSAWMEPRGTELQLGIRALWSRFTLAMHIFARAVTQAFAALRTDP